MLLIPQLLSFHSKNMVMKMCNNELSLPSLQKTVRMMKKFWKPLSHYCSAKKFISSRYYSSERKFSVKEKVFPFFELMILKDRCWPFFLRVIFINEVKVMSFVQFIFVRKFEGLKIEFGKTLNSPKNAGMCRNGKLWRKIDLYTSTLCHFMMTFFLFD